MLVLLLGLLCSVIMMVIGQFVLNYLVIVVYASYLWLVGMFEELMGSEVCIVEVNVYINYCDLD